MRILHLCHVPLPPDHPDHGRFYRHPGRWVLNLAKAQKKHSAIQPVLCTVVPGASCDYESDVEGVPVIFLKASTRLRSLTLFSNEIKTIHNIIRKENPVLIHAHGTEESYALAAIKSKLPHLFTLQGVIGIINRVTPPPLISRVRLIELIERYTLRRVRHAIAKSDYIAREIAKLFPNLILHRIPNTLDERLLDLPVPEKRPLSLAFVGSMTYRKGPDLMAKALQQPELDREAVTLDIFGNATPAATNYERETLAALRSRLGDRLTLHGVVPLLDCVKLLSICRVLVAPSREEMFGNQVLEAISVGCWPVVSSGTAMEENVRLLGIGSVFNNGDPGDLAIKIREALDHAPTLDPAQARKKLLEHFGPETVARRHEMLYREMLGRGSPKSEIGSRRSESDK